MGHHIVHIPAPWMIWMCRPEIQVPRRSLASQWSQVIVQATGNALTKAVTAAEARCRDGSMGTVVRSSGKRLQKTIGKPQENHRKMMVEWKNIVFHVFFYGTSPCSM